MNSPQKQFNFSTIGHRSNETHWPMTNLIPNELSWIKNFAMTFTSIPRTLEAYLSVCCYRPQVCALSETVIALSKFSQINLVTTHSLRATTSFWIVYQDLFCACVNTHFM